MDKDDLIRRMENHLVLNDHMNSHTKACIRLWLALLKGKEPKSYEERSKDFGYSED